MLLRRRVNLVLLPYTPVRTDEVGGVPQSSVVGQLVVAAGEDGDLMLLGEGNGPADDFFSEARQLAPVVR